MAILGFWRVEGYCIVAVSVCLHGCTIGIPAKKGNWAGWRTICQLQDSSDPKTMNLWKFPWHCKISVFMLQDSLQFEYVSFWCSWGTYIDLLFIRLLDFSGSLLFLRLQWDGESVFLLNQQIVGDNRTRNLVSGPWLVFNSCWNLPSCLSKIEERRLQISD